MRRISGRCWALLFAAACGGAPAKPKAPAVKRHDETSKPTRSVTSAVVEPRSAELAVRVVVRDTCEIRTIEESAEPGKPSQKKAVGTPREVPCGERVRADQALVLVSGENEAPLAKTDAQGLSVTDWDALSAQFLEGANAPARADVHLDTKAGATVATLDLAAPRGAAADRAWVQADKVGTMRAAVAYRGQFPGAHTAEVDKRIAERGDAEMNAAVGAALDAGNIVVARKLLDEWKALIPTASDARTQRETVIASHEQIGRVSALLAEIETSLATNATAPDVAPMQKAAAAAAELAKVAPTDKRALDAQKKVADARKQTARKFAGQVSDKLRAKDFTAAADLQAKADAILADDREVVASRKLIERTKGAAEVAATREAERLAKEEERKQKAEEAKQKAEEAKAKAEAERLAKAEEAKRKQEEARAKAEADKLAKADAERARKEAIAAAKTEAERKKLEAAAEAQRKKEEAAAEAQRKKEEALAEAARKKAEAEEAAIRKKIEADSKRAEAEAKKKAEAEAKKKGKVVRPQVATAMPVTAVSATATDTRTTHALVGMWAATAKMSGSTVVLVFNAGATGAGSVSMMQVNGKALASQPVSWRVSGGALHIAGGDKLNLHGTARLDHDSLSWGGYQWQRVRGRTVLARKPAKETK